MDYQKAINRLRGFNFARRVMEAQYRHPYCKEFSDFTITCNALMDGLKKFEDEISTSMEEGLPPDLTSFKKSFLKDSGIKNTRRPLSKRTGPR